MNKLLLLLTLCLYAILPAASARQYKGIVTFSGFTAGNGLLLAYLQKEIHYAPDALEDGDEGHVLVMWKSIKMAPLPKSGFLRTPVFTLK